jgi:hypothetical protein
MRRLADLLTSANVWPSVDRTKHMSQWQFSRDGKKVLNVINRFFTAA